MIGQNVDESLPFRELGIEYAMIAMCTDYSTTPPRGEKSGRHQIVGDTAALTAQAAFYLLDDAIKDGYIMNAQKKIQPLWMEQDVHFPTLLSYSYKNGQPKIPRPILAQMIAKDLGIDIKEHMATYIAETEQRNALK